MSAVPPLQALTESAQKGSKRSALRTANGPKGGVRARRGKRETLSFDEDARRDFLTGFSKRKQQRKQAAHEFVQKKIREEIRNSRLAAAEARRRQAEENVRAERLAFGLGDEDEDDEEQPTYEERDFETDERRAHVTVQELNLDDLDAPPVAVESLPPSLRRVSKKQDAPPAKKTKAPRAQAPAVPSGSLTAILEPAVAQAAQEETMFEVLDQSETSGKPKKQYYLSKAEREKERRKQREWNHTQAEKRRVEKGKVASAAKKRRTAIRRHP